MASVNLPKTAKGQETLEKICRAAEQLFAEKGYYNTSVVDITAAASVAPGTFYIYFEDKISVFRYLLENLGHTLRREIEIAATGCATRYDQEYIGFKTFFDFVSKHRGLYKIIWEAQFVDNDLFRDYYEKFAERYVSKLKAAQKAGEMTDIDPRILAYSLIGISNFIGLKWIIFDGKPVPDEVIHEIMRFIRRGAFST
ncbi:TetR/AcrR family transcriptional regulator [Anaeroselena agilis]|uniref:TetR/AcrR family transcriptional regulator n=1 Tax=Anaeroselena agilis TaxID=3063788 RepID=A0ABU3P2B8_9FIRM|nr:TetR/AcrR family transcriptional regulator [Selenomonadales bacterium 4137-cl]